MKKFALCEIQNQDLRLAIDVLPIGVPEELVRQHWNVKLYTILKIQLYVVESSCRIF